MPSKYQPATDYVNAFGLRQLRVHKAKVFTACCANYRIAGNCEVKPTSAGDLFLCLPHKGCHFVRSKRIRYA